MGRNWTTENAASLAPDAAALKAAQGLAAVRKWDLLGRDDDFVWGLAQGSGAQPYQVQIDLSEPAFKCSCPSRKFPCKHGLGLLLLFAAQPSAIKPGTRPAWVTEWAEKRAQKTAKPEAKATDSATSVDIAAQARRREKRSQNMAAGVDFLDGWLRDLVRQGLSQAGGVGYSYWEQTARRLIDAQAPGLARRVERLGTLVDRTPARDEEVVTELGRLHLLLSASRRRPSLSPEWQEEIDAQLGLVADQDELRQKSGVADRWFVGGQTVREDDRLITRTSYMFGMGGNVARVVEFSHASQPTVATLAVGRWVDAELVYFPGVKSPRALLKTAPLDAPPGEFNPVRRCQSVVEAHATLLAENPFVDELPVIVRMTALRDGDDRWLQDDVGDSLPIASGFPLGWELVACSGGAPIDIVGTWDGFGFAPLSVVTAGTVTPLSPRRT